MRLFAAVLPPPHVVEPLHYVVRRTRPVCSDLTWVAPELWHVTLAFFGEVAAGQVDAVVRQVASGVQGRAAMTLRLCGGGRFPIVGDPRVVWAGVGGDLAALSGLAESVGAEGPFHPHLTVARVRRRPVDVGPLVAALTELDSATFSASEVVLMHSEPGTGGSPRHYSPLAQFPLETPRR